MKTLQFALAWAVFSFVSALFLMPNSERMSIAQLKSEKLSGRIVAAIIIGLLGSTLVV